MRCPDVSEMPAAQAIARPVRCAASCGEPTQVGATNRATVPVAIDDAEVRSAYRGGTRPSKRHELRAGRQGESPVAAFSGDSKLFARSPMLADGS